MSLRDRFEQKYKASYGGSPDGELATGGAVSSVSDRYAEAYKRLHGRYPDGYEEDTSTRQERRLPEDPAEEAVTKPGVWDTLGAVRSAVSENVGAAYSSGKASLIETLLGEHKLSIGEDDYTAAGAKEEAAAEFKEAIAARMKASQMQKARDPGYGERSLYAVAGSAESAIPLIGSVAVGALSRSPQAAALTAAALAPIPAGAAYGSAFTEFKEKYPNAPDSAAHEYASKSASMEYALEAFGPGKLAKTLAATLGKRYGIELGKETLTEIGQTELGRSEGLDAPKTLGDYLKQLETLPVVVGAFSGASAPFTAAEQRAEADAAKAARPRKEPTFRTGDPQIDAGAKVAESLLKGAEFNVDATDAGFSKDFAVKIPELRPMFAQPETTVTVGGRESLRDIRNLSKTDTPKAAELGGWQSAENEKVRRAEQIADIGLKLAEAKTEAAYAQKAAQEAGEPVGRSMDEIRRVAEAGKAGKVAEKATKTVEALEKGLALRQATQEAARVPQGLGAVMGTPEQGGELVDTRRGVYKASGIRPGQNRKTRKGIPTEKPTALRFDDKGRPVPSPEPIGVIPETKFTQTGYVAPGDRAGTKLPETPATIRPAVNPEIPTSESIAPVAEKTKGKGGNADLASVKIALDTRKGEMAGTASIADLVTGKNPRANEKVFQSLSGDVQKALDGKDPDPSAVKGEARLRERQFKGFGTAGNYLLTIGNKKNVDDYKGVAADLINFNPELADVPIDIVNPGDEKAMVEAGYSEEDAASMEAGESFAIYSPSANRIAIRGAGWVGKKGGHGMTHENVIHETVHAATHYKIEHKEELTPEGQRAVEELETISTTLSNQVNTGNATLDGVPEHIVKELVEGNNRVHELLTYSMSNKEVQNALRNIKLGNKNQNALKQIFSAIKKLVGLGPKYDNLLDQILDTGGRIIREPGVDKAKRQGRGQQKEASVASRSGAPKEANLIPGKGDETHYTGQSLARRRLKRIFSRTQGKTPEINRISEENESRRMAAYTATQLLVNQINTEAQKLGLTVEDLNNPEVLAKHPSIKIRMEALENETKVLGLAVGEEYLKSNDGKLTQQSLNIAKRIFENQDYRTRTYRLHAPFGFGKKFAENRWANYQKYKDREDLTKLPPSIAQDVIDVRNAKEFLYNEYMVFTKDPSEMSIEEQRAKYQYWTGIPADSILPEQVEAKVREVYEASKRGEFNIDAVLEDAVKQSLDLTATTNKMVSMLRPKGDLDSTIVTAREDVPDAIRKLWGENTNQLVNLSQTIYRMHEYLSQLRTLTQIKEAGLGRFVFDPAKGNRPEGFTEQLLGPSWGPLEGMYTSPFIKESLQDIQEAGKGAMSVAVNGSQFKQMAYKLAAWIDPKWRAGVRGAKMAIILDNLATYAYNFIGTPLVMIQNGNFTLRGAGQGLKVAKELIDTANRTHMSAETFEAIANGLGDSAFTGELSKVEAEKAMQLIFADQLRVKGKLSDFKDDLREGLKYYGLKSGTVARRAFGTNLRRVKGVFAMMDLWGKLANYEYEKQQLAKYYEEAGLEISEDDLQKKAAERIKLTNFTYQRVMPGLKVAENYGAITWAGYFSEVFRISANNLMLGIHDVREGKRVGSKTLQRHGMKRVAGVMATMGGFSVLMNGLVSALNGDDDEEEKAIKAGLPEHHKNSILLKVDQREDGSRSYMDLGRWDTFDPVSRTGRAFFSAAAEGNVEEGAKAAAKELAGLYVRNSLLGYVLDHRNTPSLKYAAPNTYNQWRDQMDPIMGPTMANELAQLLQFVPGGSVATDTAIASEQLGKGKISFPVALANAAGARLVVFDPNKTVQARAETKYAKVMGEARADLVQRLETGRELPDDELDAVYRATVEKELEAYTELRGVIEASKAAGANRRTILKQLEDAGIKGDNSGLLVRGRFMPKVFGDQFLTEVEEDLVNNAEDRSTARQRIRALERTKRRLNKLQRKYRNWTGEEEE